MAENFGIISVHLGAGHHSETKTPHYKKLCKRACVEGVRVLKIGSSILEAVVSATKILEDSPCTNAGHGSSLTEAGTVECDASVIEGKTQRYGAVGAVSSIQNPIILAKLLLLEQINNKLSHGRIPPSFLVGEGAKQWGTSHGMTAVPQKDMTTEETLKVYRRWRKKLTRPHKSLDNVCNVNEKDISQMEFDSEVSDTVGVIGADVNGVTAAAVSSGGLIMKHPGRVGPAAVFGSGCWAQDQEVDGVNGVTSAVASATSGCGESLIRTILARECCRVVEMNSSDPTLALQHLYSEKILKSKFFNDVSERLAGSVVLMYDAKNRVGEVIWAHTTDSMCVGFMSSSDSNAAVRMSRLPAHSLAGNSVVVEGAPFRLRKMS
uniref:Uncharacterized protein n=1 Tax=Strigamia maritima TaxID=126957 RepID=T1JHH4_STRMM